MLLLLAKNHPGDLFTTDTIIRFGITNILVPSCYGIVTTYGSQNTMRCVKKRQEPLQNNQTSISTQKVIFCKILQALDHQCNRVGQRRRHVITVLARKRYSVHIFSTNLNAGHCFGLKSSWVCSSFEVYIIRLACRTFLVPLYLHGIVHQGSQHYMKLCEKRSRPLQNNQTIYIST
jgi:hypothetical protein